MERGFATLWVNATQVTLTCLLFLDDRTFGGFPVIRPSTHAHQVIQSLLPAWQKKFKKNCGRAECKLEDKTGQKTSYTQEEMATNKVIIQSTLTSEVTNQQKGQL